jgi:hypothetical protein
MWETPSFDATRRNERAPGPFESNTAKAVTATVSSLRRPD